METEKCSHQTQPSTNSGSPVATSGDNQWATNSIHLNEFAQNINYQNQIFDDSVEHILPAPLWQPAPSVLLFNSVDSFAIFVTLIEAHLKEQLVSHSYNTVGNLLRFYDSFKQQSDKNVINFYKNYTPVITSEHHTCVGLGLDLLDRIINSDFGCSNPEMVLSLYLVSGEECIKKPDDYCSMKLPKGCIEKEHVAVAARIDINGRRGFILMDPGYHVSRVVIVMQDGQFPHTGWFAQSKNNKCTKNYCYRLHKDGLYIEWQSEEIRNGKSKTQKNLFYVDKTFANPINVTERRNILSGFRSLIRRDANGQIVAGFYFSLYENTVFNLIHTNECGERIDSRIPIDYFKSTADEETEELIAMCGLGLHLTDGRLRLLFIRIIEVIQDVEFLNQIEEIDDTIDLVTRALSTY